MFGKRKTERRNQPGPGVDPGIGDRYIRSLLTDPVTEQLFHLVDESDVQRLESESLAIVPANRDVRAGVMLRAAVQLVDAAQSFGVTPPELYALMNLNEDGSADNQAPTDLLLWTVLTNAQRQFDFDPQALLALAILSGDDAITLRQMVLYSVCCIRLGRHKGSL